MKVLYFDYNFTKVQLTITQHLAYIRAWWGIGDTPLSEQMLTQFTDAYMREMSATHMFDVARFREITYL